MIDAIPGVRIHIADTGIGIQRKDLLVLFQPLGLAICQRLAKLLVETCASKARSARAAYSR